MRLEEQVSIINKKIYKTPLVSVVFQVGGGEGRPQQGCEAIGEVAAGGDQEGKNLEQGGERGRAAADL